ncbi:MAG TPA: DUF402 domain-containing protein [Candidatus Limnocylindrales bacterium]|nr:DUF402 domain-containing protein [Candidatus Limnocylindrales bacterium]
MTLFDTGQTVVVRDMIEGKPYSAWPHRVIADDGHELALLLRPGTKGMGPALWIQSFQDNDPGARQALIAAVARRDWELADWTWRHSTRLALAYPDRYYAIDPMWDLHGDLMCWYVNFQVPYQRTRIGIDTCDLHLDLVVLPDLTYHWKDEDEYDQARRLGVIGDRCHKQVEAAREQVVALVDQQAGPFAQPWSTWKPDPAWPLPTLPQDALTELAAPLLRTLPD